MSNLLIIPADIFPDMSEEERALEIQLMIERSTAIHEAMKGNISATDLLDILEYTQVDMDDFIHTLDLYGKG